MPAPLLYPVMLAVAGFSLFSAAVALLRKSDPRAALLWVVVCLVLPVAGPLLFWSLGLNRISRTARRWTESGARIRGDDIYPATPVGEAGELAAEQGHLEELRKLGDRVVSTRIIPGNRLLPLHNGGEAYPQMLRAIAGATGSIHLSVYIFNADAAGEEFAACLKEAAARGVAVRVLVDGLGEKYSFPRRIGSLLKESQVRFARFLPLRDGLYVNLRNHRKIMVVDGSVAFTGGMNIADNYRRNGPGGIRDLHFRVEGPVVTDLQKTFVEDWHFATGERLDAPDLFPPVPPCGDALVREVADGPDREYRKLQWIITGALSCARRSVRIMTPYLVPDRQILSAIGTAALRGVEVVVVLPEKNNLPYVHWATRSYLEELLWHGVRVLYQPPPFVHSKVFLVDGEWSLIGSANLDPRSLRLNFEENLEVYDPVLHGELQRHFDAAAARSREVTGEFLRGRPLGVKLVDAMARLFSPYL